VILQKLSELDFDHNAVRVIMGRGGLVKPIESGVYKVNDALRRDLARSLGGEHASNLGGLIAHELGQEFPNAEAYIADPVVTDELEPIARISGHPKFPRKSIFHALNQKATAKRYAKSVGKQYSELNLVIAHMGGGISIAAHQNGRVIDVNHAVGGEGPISPERAGSVSVIDMVSYCFNSGATEKEIRKMLIGQGGLCAHLGTNSAIEVSKMVEAGDEKATLIFDAMAYQVAKLIGEMSTVLKGKVDAILLTGGVAYDKWFTERIRERVEWIAPVHLYPGENEMEALALNGLHVIQGIAEIKEYD
jgi:butyrate kinase